MLTQIEEVTRTLQANSIAEATLEKWQHLVTRISGLSSVLIAYSGGVDSTFLAYVSHLILGEKSLAVFVQTAAESEQQNELAGRWAGEVKFPLVRLEFDLLKEEHFVSNPANRCYFCKTAILGLIINYAKEHGYITVLEGQNQDDLGDYRPGRQAVKEKGVLSPLAEAGLTKAEIRWLAHQMNLPVWNLPSSPCLASRFPYGQAITHEGLKQVDRGEAFLHELGFPEVRVRNHTNLARIEVAPGQVQRLISMSDQIISHFKSLGFLYVTVDLQGYRQGSLNEGLQL